MKPLSRSSLVMSIVLVASSASPGSVLTLSSPNPIAGGRFGEDVAGIGDVNGNGAPDVVVGAASESSTVAVSGRAYVFDGATGALLRSLVSPHAKGGGSFGFAVTSVPDTNGDGVDDVLVGAYHEDVGAVLTAGRAYVFDGATGAPILELVSPNSQTNGYFGHALAGLADENGDGRGDLLIGAINEDDGNGGKGRAYIFDGATGALISTLTSDTPTANGFFSRSVGMVPDANGDGHADVVIGGPVEASGGSPSGAGRAHLYDGATGALLRTFSSPNEESGGVFGEGVAGVPDVNGDCRGDLLIAASNETVSGIVGGRCYVFDGATGALLHTLISPNNQAGGQFGYFVAGARDLDGDSLGDLIIGAKWEEAGGGPTDGGRAYVFGGTSGALISQIVSPNEQMGGTLGDSVAALRDVDGNGGDEAIIAADREGTPSSGHVYVFTEGAGVAPSCGSGPSVANYFSGMGRALPNGNEVRIHTLGGIQRKAFVPYGAGQWGTLVAARDVDGSGRDNPLTAPGPGPVYGPQVRGWREDGSAIAKINFYAYGTLRYGANVAGGSLDADPFSEILSGAGPGVVFGPHVRGFNYDGVTLTPLVKVSFFAYQTLAYGVNVEAGDVDGDGFEEVLTGPGPSAVFGPQVRGFDVDGGTAQSIGKINFLAFASATYGVNPGAGNVDGDAYDEVLAGRGPGASQACQATGYDYDGLQIAPLLGFDVTPIAGGHGARVAAGDIDGDGSMELVASQGEGPASAPSLRTYRYAGGALASVAGGDFDPFSSAFGIDPGMGTLGY
ncbi:MAG: integrin alpha [Acidobacteriota bacterium]